MPSASRSVRGDVVHSHSRFWPVERRCDPLPKSAVACLVTRSRPSFGLADRPAWSRLRGRLVPPKPPERRVQAELLPGRLRRDPEPSLAGRDVVHHARLGADLRPGSDRQMAGKPDLPSGDGEVARASSIPKSPSGRRSRNAGRPERCGRSERGCRFWILRRSPCRDSIPGRSSCWHRFRHRPE